MTLVTQSIDLTFSYFYYHQSKRMVNSYTVPFLGHILCFKISVCSYDLRNRSWHGNFTMIGEKSRY